MQYYLKTYKACIRALSPIFVGSGEKLGKKDYIYMPWEQKIIVPDIHTMYEAIRKKGVSREFEAFLKDSRTNQIQLSDWLRDKKFKGSDYKNWMRYELDAGDALWTIKDKTSRSREIECFVKDAYGMPYVPGSSIKGMFRNALLASELVRNPQKYNFVKSKIKRAADNRDRKKRNLFLTREIKELESAVFNNLARDSKKRESAVNDCLAGLMVGDSRPIDINDLTLSRKIDCSLDGKERVLPIFRETLSPGTDIVFDVAIDPAMCLYDMEDILEALKIFENLCNQFFYEKFHREILHDHAVFLGGGCGFLSKTVIYALFAEQAREGVEITDKIIRSTLSEKQYREHRHYKDIGMGVAPHACKCTKYNEKLYNMGIGEIEIAPI